MHARTKKSAFNLQLSKLHEMRAGHLRAHHAGLVYDVFPHPVLDPTTKPSFSCSKMFLLRLRSPRIERNRPVQIY